MRQFVSLLLLIGAWLSLGSHANSITNEADHQDTANREARQAGGFSPFLDIVPGQDGTSMLVSVGGTEVLTETVYANVGIGPTASKNSYTMSYSDTTTSYLATVVGLSPATSIEGTISISTATGLATNDAAFERAYIPDAPSLPLEVYASDGNLALSLVNTATFAGAVYLNLVPSYAPPSPFATGQQMIGNVYSVRASGALAQANKPILLSMGYNQLSLGSIDPHTLKILAWDAGKRKWNSVDSVLFSQQQSLGAAIRRFTTYALVADLTWRDDFEDLSYTGLEVSALNNLRISSATGDRGLALERTPGVGAAVSRLITPTQGLSQWGTLSFTAQENSSTTELTVDVLDITQAVLLSNVTSGTDLGDLIDPMQHPTLRLQAHFTSTEIGQSPILFEWSVAWDAVVPQTTVFLPLARK